MGNQGLGDTRNNNGERFVDFCARNRLFIGGTKFPHRHIHKYTWQSPDGRTRNQIDHIAISKLFLGSLTNVKTRRGADIDSDHHLVVATLRLRPAAIAKNQFKVAKYNVDKLRDPTVVTNYNQALRQQLSTKNQNEWPDILNACKSSANAVLGVKRPKIKPWISAESWNEIQNRKHLHNMKLRTKTPELRSLARINYRSSCRKVTRMVHADRERYYNSIAEQAEQASNTGNLRGVYAAIKQISGNNIRGTSTIKSKDGTDLCTIDEQLQRWHEYFSSESVDVGNANQQESVATASRRNPRRDISTLPPTHEEIILSLDAMKNCKSAGPDNIPAELFKYGSATIAEYIAPLIQRAWRDNKIPNEWKNGVIVTIPKKGDLTQCNNWRGITLTNTIGKVMAHLILQRIRPAVEQILRKEQAGFRPGRSCADHVNTLRIIIEQSAEYNTHLYLLFIDFQRAFDTLDRNSMWSALLQKGIPPKIIELIQELYKDAEYKVRYNGRETNAFKTSMGVRQGCVLSPTLFLLLLDCVMDDTNREAPHGIKWNMLECLNDIDYADDICLMAHRFVDIRDKLIRLSDNAKKVGLKINFAKTKLMRIGTQNITPLTIDNIIIEDVETFNYLGCKITKTGGSSEDIADRINKARVAFLNLHKLWKCSGISNKTKIRIFKCSVMSVLLYGCTTWSFTKATESKIQTFVNHCLRKIFRIYWPNWISNETLWQKADFNPVFSEILKRKWTWIGHTLRRPSSEISRAVLEWNPQGQRRPGRPRNTWIRSVKSEYEAAGKSWNQIKMLARDRSRWREFVNALCST